MGSSCAGQCLPSSAPRALTLRRSQFQPHWERLVPQRHVAPLLPGAVASRGQSAPEGCM